MKKKYFLRGLGAGIALTAFVMMSTDTKQETLSDEEIKSRAYKLGLVEKEDALDQVLKQNKNSQATAEQSIESSLEPTKQVEETIEPTVQPTKEPTPTPTKEPTKETKATKKPTETKKPESDTVQYTTVTISAGMWSEDIAQKFASLGIVDNAKAFDDYLCDYGYASKIKIGEYRIPKNAGYNQIAEIITK